MTERNPVFIGSLPAICVITGGWGPERDEYLSGADIVVAELKRIGVNTKVLNIHGPGDLAKLAPWINAHYGFVLCHAEDVPTAQILEMTGEVTSASAPWTSIALSLDKVLTYRFARGVGVPIPAFQVVRRGTMLQAPEMSPPLVVKPVCGGSSIGVARVDSENALGLAVGAALNVDHRAVIEEYVAGEEYTVASMGAEIVAIVEISVSDPCRLYTTEIKNSADAVFRVVPQESDTGTKLVGMTRLIAAGLEVCGFWRADYRADATGTLRLLDVNLLPYLGVSELGLMRTILNEADLEFWEFLELLLRKGYRVKGDQGAPAGIEQ